MEYSNVKYSNWALRRRLTIFIVITLILSGMGYFFYDRYKISQLPIASCSDGLQNQNEKGIDCEGTCTNLCVDNYRPIRVLYTKAIESKYKTYDLVAMLANDNLGKSAGNTPYIFRIYDNAGIEIASSTGYINIVKSGRVPVIATNVRIDGPVYSSTFEIVDNNNKYYPVTIPVERVMVSEYKYDNQDRKLYIKIKNNTLESSNKLKIKAIIYDGYGAKAVGESVSAPMASREEKDIYMTWPSDIHLDQSTHRVEIYITDEND